MKKRIGTLVFLVAVSAFTLAQWGTPDPFDTPAYHAAAPVKGQKLPPILQPAALGLPPGQHGIQDKVYTLAAKIPNVLYQQPCYCHCDKSAGHTSLHSCFASEHGAHCAACMQEAVLSYQMTKQGKTPAQIRKSIMAGDWQKVDLTKVNEIN